LKHEKELKDFIVKQIMENFKSIGAPDKQDLTMSQSQMTRYPNYSPWLDS